jgi:hypothetical protein
VSVIRRAAVSGDYYRAEIHMPCCCTTYIANAATWQEALGSVLDEVSRDRCGEGAVG